MHWPKTPRGEDAGRGGSGAVEGSEQAGEAGAGGHSVSWTWCLEDEADVRAVLATREERHHCHQQRVSEMTQQVGKAS